MMRMSSFSVSRKSDTIFGQGTIPEPSTSHIGNGVALVARTAAFVYIYARISQIAEMTLSFHATDERVSRERGMALRHRLQKMEDVRKSLRAVGQRREDSKKCVDHLEWIRKHGTSTKLTLLVLGGNFRSDDAT